MYYMNNYNLNVSNIVTLCAIVFILMYLIEQNVDSKYNCKKKFTDKLKPLLLYIIVLLIVLLYYKHFLTFYIDDLYDYNIN